MKNRTPVISTTLNITLILFFIGLFFFVAVAGQVIVDVALDQFVLKLVVSDTMTPEEADKFIVRLKETSYTDKAEFVSKQEALKRFKGAGEMLEVMGGANPLPATIEITVKREYLTQADLDAIAQKLVKQPEVYDIYYSKDLIDRVVENRVGFQAVAGVVGILLVLAAFFLIVNTVKLSIYSRRLVIRSMQLIGATTAYIRAPYIRNGILQGGIAGTLAALCLFGLVMGLQRVIPDVEAISLRAEIFVLYFSLILFGAALGWFSSYVAVNRYLNKNLDQII
ncbi:MAG: permease-like cell division protein FtsX [Bacteroidetes bacterium]|nr:permease-like cell division protein FtsX [Bacteroidota bacterium]